MDFANTSLEDIDEFDATEPQFATEYVKEIFEYLRKKEIEDKVPHDYMRSQADIRPRYRDVLVDWMVSAL